MEGEGGMKKEMRMRRRSVLTLTLGLCVFALMVFTPLSASAQVTITGVVVTVGDGSLAGTAVYCDASQPTPLPAVVPGPQVCDGRPWNLGSGVLVPANQSLVLTQTNLGPTNPNFDTSDRFPQPSQPGVDLPCNTTTPCTVTVYINSGSGLVQVYQGGTNGNPVNDPLNNFNSDTLNTAQNEATNWVPVSTPTVTTYSLSLGYADNVHGTGPRVCGAGQPICAPNPFDGILAPPANIFIGNPEPAAGSCSTNCYDAGALLIIAGSNTPPPPPPTLGPGDTATIGFWHNKNGQAVINCVNGGSTSTSLGNYLASTYPSLFGAGVGSLGNLAGKTNAEIAAIYLGSTYFGASGQKVNAQILAVALATYVTSSALSGPTNCGADFGFNFSVNGIGVKTYNVGPYGTAIGLQNNTSYTIFQLLQAANAQKAAGTFNADAFNAIFDGINTTGDII
jgi:hypothetical protein